MPVLRNRSCSKSCYACPAGCASFVGFRFYKQVTILGYEISKLPGSIKDGLADIALLEDAFTACISDQACQ